MSITARELVQDGVEVVHPDLSLTELERRFLEKGVSGFPVVSDGKLVGIVSRSDVVRALCVERTLSETVTYLYKVYTDDQENLKKDANEVADRAAKRHQELKVGDVMIRKVICAAPDAPLFEIARILVEHDIHRVPITEEGRLLGIISTLDLARLFVEGRAGVE